MTATTTTTVPARRVFAAWESPLLNGRAAALAAARQQIRVSTSVRRNGGYGRRAVSAARLTEAAQIRRAVVAGHLGAALLATPAQPIDPHLIGGARYTWRSLAKAARRGIPGARSRALRIELALRAAYGLRVTAPDADVCRARREDPRDRHTQIRACLAAYAALLTPGAPSVAPMVRAYGAAVYSDVVPLDRLALDYATT